MNIRLKSMDVKETDNFDDLISTPFDKEMMSR
jgi:hypothetical protein